MMNDMFLLPTRDGYTTVKVFNEDLKLEVGVGYIYKGKVYIYKGKVNSGTNLNTPGLYTIKGDEGLECMFIDTHNEKPDGINVFDTRDIRDMSPTSILENITSDPSNFTTEEDLEEILVDRETYIPIIKNADDFLKVAIKRAIIGKQVNIKKRYKDEFDSPSRLANMISALNGQSKMSTTYWADWVNMLGLDWEIRIYDNGNDTRSPLKEDIILSSDEF